MRWAEWAALSPMFRLHGSGLAGTHTPWSYDAQTVEAYRSLSLLHEPRRPAHPTACGGQPTDRNAAGLTVHGRQTITISAPLTRLPLFFRCGTRPFAAGAA